MLMSLYEWNSLETKNTFEPSHCLCVLYILNDLYCTLYVDKKGKASVNYSPKHLVDNLKKTVSTSWCSILS